MRKPNRHPSLCLRLREGRSNTRRRALTLTKPRSIGNFCPGATSMIRGQPNKSDNMLLLGRVRTIVVQVGMVISVLKARVAKIMGSRVGRRDTRRWDDHEPELQ